MAYKLKLYLDTSIYIKEETSTVFTSKMLKYEPSTGRKLVLENYPMFTPYVAYPKERILNMRYYQRVELFFNKTKVSCFFPSVAPGNFYFSIFADSMVITYSELVFSQGAAAVFSVIPC